jgi:hypothetical protein
MISRCYPVVILARKDREGGSRGMDGWMGYTTLKRDKYKKMKMENKEGGRYR